MARPPRLSDPEIETRLARLPGWARTGDAITRSFAFAGFPEAVEFVARLVGLHISQRGTLERDPPS